MTDKQPTAEEILAKWFPDNTLPLTLRERFIAAMSEYKSLPVQKNVAEFELCVRKQVHDIVNGLTHPNVAIDEILKSILQSLPVESAGVDNISIEEIIKRN